MFGLGGWEIGILIVFGLLFFGPKKLPQLMKQAGTVMREIRKASSEFQFSLERELEDDQYKRAHRRAKKQAKLLAEKGEAAPPADASATAPAPSAGANGNGHVAEPASEPAPAPAATDVKPEDRT